MRKTSALIGSAVGLLILSGCGKAAVTLTPVQFVHAAAASTTKLTSYKMVFKADMTGTISLASSQCGPGNQLPPALDATVGAASQGKPVSPLVAAQVCAALAQQATQPPQAYAMKVTGTGSFRAPGDFAADMTTAISGGPAGSALPPTSVKVVHVGGATYVNNPTTGAWTTLDSSGVNSASFDSLDAGAYASFLDAAKSVKDLGDTSIGGTRVHHYLVTVDPDYLVQQSLKKPVFKDPAMQQLITQYASSFRDSSTTVETWIGVDDQLMRREIFDLTPTTPAAAGSTGALAGLVTNLKEHSQVDLSDFNSKVTITAPPH